MFKGWVVKGKGVRGLGCEGQVFDDEDVQGLGCQGLECFRVVIFNGESVEGLRYFRVGMF